MKVKQLGLHMYESKTHFYDVVITREKGLWYVIEWTGRIPVTEGGFPIAHGNKPSVKEFATKKLANDYADAQIAKRSGTYEHNPRMEPKKMTWLVKRLITPTKRVSSKKKDV